MACNEDEDDLLNSDEIDSDSENENVKDPILDGTSMDTETAEQMLLGCSDQREAGSTIEASNSDLKRTSEIQFGSGDRTDGIKRSRRFVETVREAPNQDSLKLRRYQLEVSEKILRGENDIIILPTGTGKTAVAVNLIQQHLKEAKEMRRGSVKVIFLAPRVVLAKQQFEYIEEHTKTQCRQITGATLDSMDMLKEHLTGTDYSVIVATPQIIVNYFIAFETASMTQFSLVVFDECHHASGEGPYQQLLNIYLEEKLSHPESAGKLPQLVGLTASVGVGRSKGKIAVKQHLLSLCTRISLNTPPKEVVEAREELKESQDPPLKVNSHVERFRTDPFSECVKKIMKEIISYVKDKMKQTPVLHAVNKQFQPNTSLHDVSLIQKVSDAIIGLSSAQPERTEDKDVILDCKQSLLHLEIYHRALVRANLATLTDAFEYLKTTMEKPVKSNALRNCSFYKRYEDEWQHQLKDISAKEPEYPNSKLQSLREQLDKILEMQEKRIDDGFASKVIIFVEYRWLARSISEWLNSVGEDYKSERFVSSLSVSDEDNMSAAEASRVMSQFRDSELNILVATSVLSEGIDVPDCNGVIRYMYIKDVITEIQVPGRVRSKDGRVVAIFDSHLEEQYVDNMNKEKWMDEGLADIRKLSSEYFNQKMGELQQTDYRKLQAAKLAKQKLKDSPSVLKDANILCMMCKSHVGKFKDIYIYIKNNYIFLNPDQTKVKLEFIGGSGVQFDGIMESGELVCIAPKCGAVLGKLHNVKLKDMTQKVGKWDINAIHIADDQDMLLVNRKKWKYISSKYYIPEISHEELIERASNGKLLD